MSCKIIIILLLLLAANPVACDFSGELLSDPITLPHLVPGALSDEGNSTYGWHTNVKLTWFFTSAEEGTCFDSLWYKHFGGEDHPYNRTGFYPAGFTPGETPFYIALPIHDFTANARISEIPWVAEVAEGESALKNRWIQIKWQGKNCWGQTQDCLGNSSFDDFDYVFKNEPFSFSSSAIDISPALRDCLGVTGVASVDWRFVDEKDVPSGSWKDIITTRGICHYGCQ